MTTRQQGATMREFPPQQLLRLHGNATGFSFSLDNSIILMHVFKEIVSRSRRCTNHTKPRGKNENTFVRPQLYELNQVMGTGATAVSASECTSTQYMRVQYPALCTFALTRTYIKHGVLLHSKSVLHLMTNSRSN